MEGVGGLEVEVEVMPMRDRLSVERKIDNVNEDKSQT